MKKRLLSLFTALCLLLGMTAVSARADGPTYADPVDVATAQELLAALPGTPNPDPIPVARLAANITVDADHSVYTMGKLIVPEGFTLTIADGADVEAEVENRGTIVVEGNGLLAATMGGNIVNYATLTVEEEGAVRSQKGGELVNHGTLTLDGRFECGCVNTGAGDEMWFENDGTVEGSGEIIAENVETTMAADLDNVILQLKTALGYEHLPAPEGKVKISRLLEVDNEEDLLDALCDDRELDGDLIKRCADTYVRLAGDVTLQDFLVSYGQIIIPPDVTLTVEPEEDLTAILDVNVLNLGTLVVKGDGTMNVPEDGFILNFGTIEIEDYAWLNCDYGAFYNRGTLVLDGAMRCRCFHDGEDQMCFENTGTVSGHGEIILFNRDGEENPADLDGMIYQTKEMLGYETLPAPDGCVAIKRMIWARSVDALVDAFPDDRQIDEIEGNGDTNVYLLSDAELHDNIASMGTLIVGEGVTLTICEGASLSVGVVNNGTIVVERGAQFATTMGGDIANYATINVERGGAIESQMGGSIRNFGKLTLDGALLCGSVKIDGEPNPVTWLDDHGTVSGTGYAVVKPVQKFGDEPDALADRLFVTEQVKEVFADTGVTVLTAATDYEEISSLLAEDAVDGVCVMPEDGMSASLVHLTGDLDIGEKLLMIADTDLVIDHGATLTIPEFDRLLFGNGWSRIVTEAAGAASPDAPAGGTLVIEGTKVMSGTDTEAVYMPTQDILFVSAASYSDFPSTAVWIYVGYGAEARAEGALPTALSDELETIVDGTLRITGDFATRFLELHGGLTKEDGAEFTVRDVYYCADSQPDALYEGTNSTVCGCAVDLNTGGWDYYGPVADDDGVVCFEDNGAFLPNRPDAIFNGWEITSPWQGSPLWTDAMAQELAAAEVRVEGGKHYITLLSKCPVIVTALWSNPLSEHSLHTDEIDDFRYLLHSPLNEEGNKALIVYLHDEGAKGDDLSLLTAADGLPKYLNNGDLFDLDAYVLIPQLPADKNGWADVRGSLYALIDAVCEAYPDINPECISLTGDGMGGTGTWEIALADPNRFAAIAPLSGSVDATDENAKALKWMNVFAVVGENDAVVSPDSSREFIEKLRETQGYSAEARFTVLEGAGHADVPGAYLDEELGLLQWLCMQWRAPNLAFGKCGARGGNLTWDIDYMGTLTIRGTGEMAGYQYGTPPWDMYSDEIENLVIEEGVTTLGDYAFRYCEKLTNVTLPSTLTDLAWRAFFQCSSLAEISIPSGVTRIGDGVFEGCKALTAISVDAENAAYKSVDGVLFTKDGTRLMQYPASRSGAVYAVPDGVQIIDSCAFINCAELTELSLPSSVSDVAVVAIAGCEVLAAINVDAGNAVYKSVDGVLFTEDGKTLLAYPAGKSDLAYTVPDGVTELGDGSFIGCENLERIALPASVETIAAEAFTSCRGLWSVTGGAGVKEIGNAAFGACVNLQEFALPSGLETLGELAFLGCARLTSVTIPSGLTSVSRGAFYGCKALTSVTLPASVTTIARSAFSDCTAISDVYFGGTREQWNAIAFDRGNETLRSATLHLATDELRFAITAASLTLTDSIAINYKVPAALFTDGGEYSEPYMVFTLNGEDFRVDDYRVSDANYIFTFRNIAPHKMNDVVTATLYARRGAQLCASRAVEYSVVQYCRNMLARYSTYEYYEFRTLLVDLLLYGAKAQAYMNYRMDAPADGALTPEQLEWATGGMPPLTTVQDVAAEKVADGDRRATWSAVTLYLQDSVAIRLRLTNVSGAEDLSVRVTGTNDEWTIPASEWTAADGAYYVTFSALNPAQMRESLDFTVCAGETPVSDTLRYSVESYAYAQKDKNDPRLNDLLTAMLRYGDAAREYAG